MNKLLTQRDVCALLRISYPTLCRWLNEGRFVQPLNGRKRKLLFDSIAVERWVNTRQQPVIPAVSSLPAKQKQRAKERQRRLELARTALERHRKPE